MRCLLTIALPLLTQHALQTLANTEILNFPAGNPVPVATLPGNWTVLQAGANEIIVRDKTPAPLSGGSHDPLCDDDEDVNPFMRRRPSCSHELWLALDLDGDAWKSYDRFTLRVSWPASHPAHVKLSLHRPAQPSPPPPPPPPPSSPSTTRTARLHLARIRLSQEGVRVPRHAGLDLDAQHHGEEEEEEVPLVVLLEPLVLFGVLPASVLPTVAVLLGVLGVVACGVLPWVLRALEVVVEKARRELADLEEERKKR